MTSLHLPVDVALAAPGRRGGGAGEPAPHQVPPPDDLESTGRLLLTVEEAARRLGIGRTLMYGYLQSGELKSIRIGRCRRVTPEDLTAFVQDLRLRSA